MPSETPNEPNEPIEPNEIDESDSESDEEIDKETTDEICGPKQDICNDIQRMKYRIYELIVLSPANEDSDEAQDNKLLQKYIDALDIICTSAEDNAKNKNNMTEMARKNTDRMNALGYSSDTVDAVNTTILTLNDYAIAHPNNMTAYIAYITNQFRVFPFVQLPYFPE
jgi:hypothetical protein